MSNNETECINETLREMAENNLPKLTEGDAPMQCHNCNRVWAYTGDKYAACCPECHYKVTVSKHRIDRLKGAMLSLERMREGDGKHPAEAIEGKERKDEKVSP